AAGLLLVEEAGGKATDMAGEPSALEKPDWLVSNGRLHEAVLTYSPRVPTST
ncbi:MAG: inositol monophosphatase, partial [Anaerolineae bacterium]|nr:inositol monophosphatase [Anaerolineae bacterium]